MIRTKQCIFLIITCLYILPLQAFAAPPLWSKTFSLDATWANALGIAVDPTGSTVVATGDSHFGGGSVMATNAYNANTGDTLSGWPVRGTYVWSRGYKVDFDGANNVVYVVGTDGTPERGYAWKYSYGGGAPSLSYASTNGERTFDGDYDALSNALYTISEDNSADTNWVIDKYDSLSTGAPTWEQTQAGRGAGEYPAHLGIVVNTANSARYLLGMDLTNYYMRLVKKTVNGSTPSWNKYTYYGTGGEYVHPDTAIVLDSTNAHIYVLAQSSTITDRSYIFKILESNGSVVAGWPIIAPFTAGGIGISPDGSIVYVTGFNGPWGLLSTTAAAAYRTLDAAPLWSLSSADGEWGIGRDIASDNAGNIYIAGKSPNSAATGKFSVKKFGAFINTAPTAAAQSITTDQDVPKVVTLPGSDVDGCFQSFKYGVTQPAHGTVIPKYGVANCTGSGAGSLAAAVTYSPTPGYSGPDSFTFVFNDRFATTTFPATVSVIVNSTATYTLDVSKAGAGSGLVTGAPGGIACGAACSASYSGGTTVNLTATQNIGSTFTGWSSTTGVSCPTVPPAPPPNPCSVPMTKPQIVTATFALAATPTVSITANPTRVSNPGISTISWDATSVNSCFITRNGVMWKPSLLPDVTGHVFGSSVPPETITTQTIYKITCTSSPSDPDPKTATVNVVPFYQDF